MSTESFLTSDLRHAGTAVKRFHDHKAKWAHGDRNSNHITRLPIPSTHPHPAVAGDNSLQYVSILFWLSTLTARPKCIIKRLKANDVHRFARTTNRAFHFEVQETLDEKASSSEEETSEKDESVALDTVGIHPDETFEYEATGHTILSNAVNHAIEKFENQETEKLVQEYEIVTRESEAANAGYLADDDLEGEYVKV